MNWARTQAGIDAAAASRPRTTSRPGRREITHFEPDDLSYLRGLKETLAAAGLMPPGTRTDPNALINPRMLNRARLVKARWDPECEADTEAA